MAAIPRARALPLFLAALVAGASYYADHWLTLEGGWTAAWKGSGVAMLALWAAMQAERGDGWLIAGALALGAAGDVLLETHGLTAGALAFLAGHGVAVVLYLRHRLRPLWGAFAFAVAVALIAQALPAEREGAAGIALYALGLGAMAGTALTSRFPLRTVGLGALLFVLSDLLIFARMGPLAASSLPGLLIWPTYFAGQALIAWGVVNRLAEHDA